MKRSFYIPPRRSDSVSYQWIWSKKPQADVRARYITKFNVALRSLPSVSLFSFLSHIFPFTLFFHLFLPFFLLSHLFLPPFSLLFHFSFLFPLPSFPFLPSSIPPPPSFPSSFPSPLFTFPSLPPLLVPLLASFFSSCWIWAFAVNKHWNDQGRKEENDVCLSAFSSPVNFRWRLHWGRMSHSFTLVNQSLPQSSSVYTAFGHLCEDIHQYQWVSPCI